MASFESKIAKIIDKFNGGKFNIWKFKCYWDPCIFRISWTDPKNLHLLIWILSDEVYQKRVIKVMYLIGLNLVDNRIAHI